MLIYRSPKINTTQLIDSVIQSESRLNALLNQVILSRAAAQSTVKSI